MEIAPKGLTFCSWNSSPKDSFFVNGNRAQMTRFLFIKLEPRGLGFCSATSPKIQTRIDYLHSHTPHNRSLTLITGPHREHSSNPNTGPHSHSHSYSHSHSNLVPCHSKSQTHIGPHNTHTQTQTPVLTLTLTQTSHCATPSLKPTPVLTTDLSHSNPHRSSVSHSSNSHSHSLNLALTDLVTLQALTLTQTSRRATIQPHHSSNLAPLLNLNMKVGTPSQFACFD